MSKVQSTNICCLDLQKESIDYLKGLGLHVFEGSLGSVLQIDWNKLRHQSKIPVLVDCSYPINLQEYHVFVHDMKNAKEKEYKYEEHDLYGRVENPSQMYLECSRPITIYDLRPYGSHILKDSFDSLGEQFKYISVVFVSNQHAVEYRANDIGYDNPRKLGEFTNDEAWNIVSGYRQFGKRVRLVDNRKLSFALFNNHLDSTEYYRIFKEPTVWKNDKWVVDEKFYPLLQNEDGDCVAYAYIRLKPLRIDFVFPQVSDKKRLLKALFEEVLFKHFSDFFPDIEAAQWIHKQDYEMPNETALREKIEARKEVYEKEMKQLEADAESVRASNKHLKDMLTATGDDLVAAVRAFLEYLGFKKVVDKDSTLKEGEIREEDLAFSYNGTEILVEVKGINGTSTDSECSQIDKVVLRRIRKTKNANHHGVYVVNNQRNVEPLKRQIPPFNKTQIKDAENQGRTMVYSAQLFALYFDIENGYVNKESVRESFLIPGLLEPHNDLISLGVPPKFYADRTVLCFHLKNTLIQKGDIVYYLDELQRMVGAEVLDIQIDKKSLQSATSGEVSIKVSKAFPRSGEVFVRKAK